LLPLARGADWSLANQRWAVILQAPSRALSTAIYEQVTKNKNRRSKFGCWASFVKGGTNKRPQTKCMVNRNLPQDRKWKAMVLFVLYIGTLQITVKLTICGLSRIVH
jgi:hypothetical protein